MFNIRKSVKDLHIHSVKETFIMALNSYQVTVHGTAGLLCSNVQNSDPLGEGAKQKASNLMDLPIHICQVLTSCVALETLLLNGS